MLERGKIGNVARATQLRDFSGLRFARGITPTDVDCMLEFDNKAYVLIEAKSNGAEVPYGQRTALSRYINDFHLDRVEKKAVLIIATHNIPPDQPIPFADIEVLEVFEHGQWETKRYRGRKVRQFIVEWLARNGLGHLASP